MELMIQKILSSDVPVVGYVSPGGAKAASAGYYILMACDVAVMAPGTRTGAATPIIMGGGGESEDESLKTLLNKVKGDSRAFLRSLVRGRMRNPDVPIDETVEKAMLAIDESEAFTEQEALESGMIDFTANSIEDILERLDDTRIRRFTLEGEEPRYTEVDTTSARVVNLEMDMRQKFLSYISNPMIALLLGAVGIFGLYIEFTNPGLIFPGAVGAICLVLAGISFQILTVNWAGLLLVAIAIVLFVLEFKITSYGLLTIGGIICLILGGLMLFEGPIPELRLNLWQLVPFAITFAFITLFLLRLVVRAHTSKVTTGGMGLVGAQGVINKDGKAFVHGEIWNIEGDEEFSPGDEFIVEKVDNLNLRIRKADK
jgi:membrane-bound serine protease (ClpP class)